MNYWGTVLSGEFQYNICTCGAKSFKILNIIIIQFQYNICTCGAAQGRGMLLYNKEFQYNICTCGALLEEFLARPFFLFQ